MSRHRLLKDHIVAPCEDDDRLSRPQLQPRSNNKALGDSIGGSRSWPQLHCACSSPPHTVAHLSASLSDPSYQSHKKGTTPLLANPSPRAFPYIFLSPFHYTTQRPSSQTPFSSYLTLFPPIFTHRQNYESPTNPLQSFALKPDLCKNLQP